MQVIVRPLKRDVWSGIKKYKNCYDYLSSYWTRSGRRYTGLSKDDEIRLGKELGLDLSPNSSFWVDQFHIKIGDKDMYLDISDPMDELRYLFLRNHKRVKKSLTENKAGADYALINEAEEAKKVNVLNKIKRDAIKAFDQLSPTEIRKALRLYGENADDMSSEVAEQRLFDLVEGHPQRFMEKWINNKSRETEVLLMRAISKNVIRKVGNAYKYGSDIIGRVKSEAIDFLDNPENQDVKRTIILEVDAKDYIDEHKTSTETSKMNKLVKEVKEEVEVKDVDNKKSKTSKSKK